MRLEWTEPAAKALEGIRQYIARDEPVYALRFTERLVETATVLMDHSRIG